MKCATTCRVLLLRIAYPPIFTNVRSDDAAKRIPKLTKLTMLRVSQFWRECSPMFAVTGPPPSPLRGSPPPTNGRGEGGVCQLCHFRPVSGETQRTYRPYARARGARCRTTDEGCKGREPAAAAASTGSGQAVDLRSSSTPTWLRTGPSTWLRTGIDQDMTQLGCCRKMVCSS